MTGTPISEEIPGIVVTAETTSLTDVNISGSKLSVLYKINKYTWTTVVWYKKV